jgi:hypothetical protein
MNEALAVVKKVYSLKTGSDFVYDPNVGIPGKQANAAREMNSVFVIATCFEAGKITRNAWFHKKSTWRIRKNRLIRNFQRWIRGNSHEITMRAQMWIVVLQSSPQFLKNSSIPDFTDGLDGCISCGAFFERVGAPANDGAVRHEHHSFPGPGAVKALSWLEIDLLWFTGPNHRPGVEFALGSTVANLLSF